MCDDGIEGTGKCVCLGPSNDPDSSIFCQGVVDEEKKHKEELQNTFDFARVDIMAIAFLTTLLLYFYHVIPALHAIPESVTSIIIGIFIGIFFLYYW